MIIGELIDIAIGYPESSNVNFSALHCLLIRIVNKLEMTDDVVDFCNNETEEICWKKLSNHELVKKTRLIAGSNPAEKDDSVTPSEPETNASQESQSAAEMTEKYLDIDENVNSEILIQPTSEGQPGGNIQIHNEKSAVEEFSKETTASTQSLVRKLEERITKIEMVNQSSEVPIDISSGISVMKDQLEFLIEQMLLLTFLTLSKKPDFRQIQQLYSMAQTLLAIKKENIFIESSKHIQLPTAPSLDWQSSGLQLNEDLLDNDIFQPQSIESARAITADQTTYPDELDNHLCYSPSKLLDQLMELKSDCCLLTNKVNELSARLLQEESQQTVALIQEIKEQMRDIKVTTGNIKDNQSSMESRITSNHSNLETMKESIEKIMKEKVDKTNMEIELSNKVDYNQLQRKVSLDQFLELQCRIDKKFYETVRRISESDRKFSETIENLKTTLGFAAINEVLKKFKESITQDIQALHQLLNNYIDLTNDDCAAAGSRIKVLHDLACLSCDTNCVMRMKEIANVAKLPSAKATNIISPLITYELGSIRKSGIMGYYRKDEFPHATNAWLAHQSNTLTGPKQCVPRHAGGPHTSNNAKERFQKTIAHNK